MQIILQGLLIVFLVASTSCVPISWVSIPSIRAGQIEVVTNLMTAEDTSTNSTQHTFVYDSLISTGTNVSQLQYGLSLISYESWMTDTFSFNATMVALSYSGATVSFVVLDNTFFSKAKLHYIVIWSASLENGKALTKDYFMEVIYGCYLTDTLLVLPGTTDRSEIVGGQQSSKVASLSSNIQSLVVLSMFSGFKLSNNIGKNDYVRIDTFLNSSSPPLLYHTISVESNNFLTFFCASTVILDPSVHLYSYLDIFEYTTYLLNVTNNGLKDLPYMERFDGTSRMFFGISQFNLSMSDTRYINVQTSNITLISLLYDKNAAMNQIRYHTLFFARRFCANSTYYEPINYTCLDNSSVCVSSVPLSTTTTTAANVCKPCHYSCLACTLGNNVAGCSSCPTSSNRIATPISQMCSCLPGFTDVGVTNCILCNGTLVGCLLCSSSKNCTQCDNTTYQLTVSATNALNHACACKPGFYMASGFCLNYSGCLIATQFNNMISCFQCDTTNNFIQNSANYTCVCNLGYILNSTTNLTCYDKCGDNITAAGTNKCDDGNAASGDGCDQFCNIETGYHCSYNITNGTPGYSTCVLKHDITISYLYASRIITQNSFEMAFSLAPSQSGLTSNSFQGNINTSLPVINQKIRFDPDASIIYIDGTYTQSIQDSTQSITVSFNNMTFYADKKTIQFTAVGINADLIIQSLAASNTILEYLFMSIALLALLIAIFASVVGLKMIGIELLIPIQLIYFTMTTLPKISSHIFVINNLKYVNGFNTIQTYTYSRTYSQHLQLITIMYETEFLLSTNIMLGIFVFVLLWLLIHHFRLKYKQYKLEKFLEENSIVPEQQQIHSNDSEEDKEDAEQDEQKVKLKKNRKNKSSQEQQREFKLRQDHHRSFKVFTFEVDRIYFIFYLILINQMMFGFIIMTLNVPISTFVYPEQINVLVCNFIFFIFIGNIVFISYDQESNKMIAFTCIKDRYAYVYLLLDFIIIIILAMTFQESFSTYLICVLCSSFVVLIIKQKPYGSVFFTFQNIITLYLHIMLMFCQIVFCLIQSEVSKSEKTQLIYTFIIAALIIIGEILTIIRIAVKVNFKKAFDDLKNPNIDNDADKKKKKVIEKNLDLLEDDKKIEIIPPDSVRNGLFTPKDKMIDWESRNTEEYESMRQRQMENNPNYEAENPDDEGSENKEQKLNELQILKKRLRNNLKLKKQQDGSVKKEI